MLVERQNVIYFFQFSESGILAKIPSNMGFPGVSDGKQSASNAGDPGLIPESEDPLEKGMATHSSILAWRISRTEEPGGH